MDKGTAGFLVVTLVCILVKHVHGNGNNNQFYCNADLCNRGKAKQFCSSTFKYCRDCSAIVGSCGIRDQPINCTSYCVEHMTELKMKEKRDGKCFIAPNVTNSNVDTNNHTSTHDQGVVLQLTCKRGYRLEYTGEAYCGPFGEFRYRDPTCKEVKCRSPPFVPNGNVIDESDDSVYDFGHNVSYKCNSGYSMYGATTLTCTVDGVWTPSTNIVGPVCLQDRSDGWMYACFIMTGIVIVTCSWSCVQSIRRLKRKNTSVLDWCINTFHNRRLYSSVKQNTDEESGRSRGTEYRNDHGIKSNRVKSETSVINDTRKNDSPVCRRELNKSNSISTDLQRLRRSAKDNISDKEVGIIKNKVVINFGNTDNNTAIPPEKDDNDKMPASISQDACQMKLPTVCTGETVIPLQPESALIGDLDIKSLLNESNQICNTSDILGFQFVQAEKITYTKIRPPLLQRSISAPPRENIHGR